MSNKVRVALIGVGNASCIFVQGLDYYADNNHTKGLWHKKIGGLKPSDVTVVAAFDIDPGKVGQDLKQVVNRSPKKYHSVRKLGIDIKAGLLSDEPPFPFRSENTMTCSSKEFSDILETSNTNVVVNLISSGLDRTAKQYAYASLDAGIPFINATPTRIAGNEAFSRKFGVKKIPLVGDDLLSQLGGTALHKGIIDFLVERGAMVRKSYQLDVSGNTDTQNTMVERIKMAKRRIKTKSIAIEAPYDFESVAGTTEYANFLRDSRNSYYWVSSEGFLGSSIVIDMMLQTSDGANAGNVLLDAVRAVYAHHTSNVKNGRELICGYSFKDPPVNGKIRDAYRNFIAAFG
jgi:myo-inositol-1-phosphate synthase